MNDVIIRSAKRLRLDRWPVIGAATRKMGRLWNTCRHFETGVEAIIDGEFRIKTSPRAFSGGRYDFDPSLISVLKTLGTAGGDLLDVGAHVGIASLVYRQLSQPDTRIAAFEPNPNVYPLLVENCRLNGNAIETYRVALAEKICLAQLYVNGRDANASLSHDAPGNYWYWQGKEKPQMVACKTPVTTIDAFCDSLGFAPGLIKLDVEGAELLALRGAANTLKRYRPKVLMETHVFAWQSFGYSAEDLERLVSDYGYEILDANGRAHTGKLGEGPQRDNNHFILRCRSQ